MLPTKAEQVFTWQRSEFHWLEARWNLVLYYPVEDAVLPLCQIGFSGLFDDLTMDHSGLIDKSENGGIAVPNDVEVINRCMECVRSYSRRHLFCQWS